ncbi:N utilization substance protein B [Aequitasia blattaphilus]|uniref:Transcription antitermination protein NusB n=1 Tax=Aequitasia blattaphilus TaxID=2949332 RepID=A0ABT1E5Y7_9FIRM|nr:transcription antitermination factor NusB [Aequitasia blattaphilus]MCP1101163.1 transcription antitermination factor NusB [Aequitasia blattaphilus]MCR8613803.1 transcription antitermination factor NusB [Aequitasia blattaphilus]
MSRKEQREHIFRLVFGLEFNEVSEMPEQIKLYFEQLPAVPEEDQSFIRDKACNIGAKREEIDRLLNEKTTGWKTSRMNKVDLTILRLAIYEINWDEEVPCKVAINEAIELAKKYSGEGGPAFVNGVLAKFA